MYETLQGGNATMALLFWFSLFAFFGLLGAPRAFSLSVIAIVAFTLSFLVRSVWAILMVLALPFPFRGAKKKSPRRSENTVIDAEFEEIDDIPRVQVIRTGIEDKSNRRLEHQKPTKG